MEAVDGFGGNNASFYETTRYLLIKMSCIWRQFVGPFMKRKSIRSAVGHLMRHVFYCW